MKWVILLICTYVTYYTFMYAIILGREGKKIAMASVIFLAISTLVLPVLVLFKFLSIEV